MRVMGDVKVVMMDVVLMECKRRHGRRRRWSGTRLAVTAGSSSRQTQHIRDMAKTGRYILIDCHVFITQQFTACIFLDSSMQMSVG